MCAYFIMIHLHTVLLQNMVRSRASKQPFQTNPDKYKDTYVERGLVCILYRKEIQSKCKHAIHNVAVIKLKYAWRIAARIFHNFHLRDCLYIPFAPPSIPRLKLHGSTFKTNGFSEEHGYGNITL